MDILVRQAVVIDPSSPFHQQKVDVFIQNGFIAEIGSIQRSADKEIASEALHVSPGWADIFSNFCDPGYEFKETLESGSNAAAAGGYTDVLVVPNTAPAIHTKSAVEYITQRSKNLPASVHVIGAVTREVGGKELAEMYDMHSSGAVAFTDGTSPVQSSGILLKALQYVKAIDKVIIQLPDDKNISPSGLMNEGVVSTRIGLAGKPAIAEELMIARDIELAKYTGSKIHFTGISTAKSLQLISDAKEDGVMVTCSVTPFHLCFTEEDLYDYNTTLKVNPPLRTKADQEALKEGLLSGKIDCIATHHFPQDKDNKIVEFEYAKEGMIGLETCFGTVRTAMPDLSLEKLITLFSTNARNIFGLEASINKNQPASLTFFLPDEMWTVQSFHSKSANSPFSGKELKGKPLGIINKDKVFLNQ